MAPSGVLKFDVVGTGNNQGDEGSIFAEAGWGVPAVVEAAVQLKSTKVLKDLKITVELRGMIETRWSGDKPMIPGDVLPTRYSKRFLHLTETVRDKKEALTPNEVRKFRGLIGGVEIRRLKLVKSGLEAGRGIDVANVAKGKMRLVLERAIWMKRLNCGFLLENGVIVGGVRADRWVLDGCMHE
ncbi:hypothetical protein HDU97_007581 [Phlyctochytrium planicorne]|nr:hypothetical protein HDU97_007581 [Phlyctochytrium planicorne]